MAGPTVRNLYRDERRKTLLYSVSDIIQDAKMENQELKIKKFVEAFTQAIPYIT